MKLKIPPIIQLFLCGMLGWAASHAFEIFAFSWALLLPVSFCLIGVGIAIMVVAVGMFASVNTTVNPVDPDKAETLVTTGLYQISRNPMYLGMLFVLLGGATLFSNLSAFIGPVVFFAAITELQIKPEENVLQMKFGDAYSAYRAKTRRWI